jgi:hypothetical protein
MSFSGAYLYSGEHGEDLLTVVTLSLILSRGLIPWAWEVVTAAKLYLCCSVSLPQPSVSSGLLNILVLFFPVTLTLVSLGSCWTSLCTPFRKKVVNLQDIYSDVPCLDL